METNQFQDWLDHKLKEIGWTRYRLSKETGIPQSVLTRIMQGKRPTLEVCNSIAIALHVDPIDMLYLAGYFERPKDHDLRIGELKALYKALDEEGREDAIFLLRDRLKYQRLKSRKLGTK